ncbi:carbohydrate kinase family protein [Deinococcus irradiatisoli]|nr:carbohydrate kinase family protein [Deinococcus irradiatisoli]
MSQLPQWPLALPARGGPVVVAGGLNTDILSRPHSALHAGTSNPAHTTFAPGGVGRNLAQTLAQLGVPTRLLGVVGDDAFGESLLGLTARAGVEVSGVVRRPGPSGSYLAVLSERGELVYGLSSMALTSDLRPADVPQWAGELSGAGLLIVDANLSPPMVAFLLEAAWERGVPAVLEPVSAPKAGPLSTVLSAARPLWLLTPDRAELAALTGQDLEQAGDAEVLSAARRLRVRGAQVVLLTLGRRGSWLVGEGGALPTPARQAQVRDVTGAGDALLAGLIAALWRGADWPEALAEAHLCAALTIEAPGAVRADLSPQLLTAERHRPALHGEPLT